MILLKKAVTQHILRYKIISQRRVVDIVEREGVCRETLNSTCLWFRPKSQKNLVGIIWVILQYI